MPFVTVICTSCGGEIQLDDEKTSGFCLHCGTKVIIKEAVKISTHPPIENLIQLADSAFEDRNYLEAIGYYNRVLEIDRNNWNVIYKKGLALGWQSEINNINSYAVINATKRSLSIVASEENLSETEVSEIKYKYSQDIINIARSMWKMISIHFQKNFEAVDASPNFRKQSDHIILLLEYGVSLISAMKQYRTETKHYYEFLLSVLQNKVLDRYFVSGNDSNGKVMSITKIGDDDRKIAVKKFDYYLSGLRKIDPNYKIKDIQRNPAACYIATVVYGSYYAPQVLILRKFRDNNLQKSFIGRGFIWLYYRIGPFLAIVIGSNSRLTKFIKMWLDYLITHLNLKSE